MWNENEVHTFYDSMPGFLIAKVELGEDGCNRLIDLKLLNSTINKIPLTETNGVNQLAWASEYVVCCSSLWLVTK